MPTPRFRFTVRRMMVAVAIVAALLAIESKTAQWAVSVVSESDGRGGMTYIRGDAILVWGVAQIMIAPVLLLIGPLIYVAIRSMICSIWCAPRYPWLPVEPNPPELK